MNLPKNEKELEQIFKNAKTPRVEEFSGEYFVEMLTGKLPGLKIFSHRKIFYPENGKNLGCNIILKNVRWGYFFLEEGVCAEVDSLGVVIINYNQTKNSFLTKGIRDYVRRVEDGLYLGRFNVLIGVKLKFLGYFSLNKIK